MSVKLELLDWGGTGSLLLLLPGMGNTAHVLGAPRAVFVGHSFAGEELTWLALEHPERVAALVYLDAAYDRAAHGKEFAGASRPEPPTTAADFESARAYGAHLSRMMEMPVPLDYLYLTRAVGWPFAGCAAPSKWPRS